MFEFIYTTQIFWKMFFFVLLFSAILGQWKVFWGSAFLVFMMIMYKQAIPNILNFFPNFLNSTYDVFIQICHFKLNENSLEATFSSEVFWELFIIAIVMIIGTDYPYFTIILTLLLYMLCHLIIFAYGVTTLILIIILLITYGFYQNKNNT